VATGLVTLKFDRLHRKVKGWGGYRVAV